MSVPDRFRKASQACSGAIIALGCAVLIGWAADNPLLKSVVRGLATMKPNTAALFLLLGSAMWTTSAKNSGSRLARRFIGCLIVIAAGLTVTEYAFGVSIGIDRLLFPQAILRDAGVSAPGRMALSTALNFCFLGSAILFFDRWWLEAGQFLVLAASSVSLAAFCGYVFGVESLYALVPFESIALHSTLGFMTACCALLFARPEEGMMTVIGSDTAAGRFVRRLIPGIVFIPVALGLMLRIGQREGFYDVNIGTVLLVLATIGSLTVLAAAAAATLFRSENELRMSEARSAAILNSSLDAVVSMDHNGRIVEFNAAAEKMFGYGRGEVIGKPLAENLIPAELRDRHRQGVVHHLEGGGGSILGRITEFSAMRGDGSQFPAEIAIARVDGECPPMFTGYIRDITDRKRSADRFRLAIEAAPTGMLMVDERGYIVLSNAHAKNLFGYKDDELLGKSIEQLVPERFRTGHAAQRSHFHQDPSARSMGMGRDLFGLRKDGGEVPVEIGLNPLQTPEGTFVLASIVDVTARKRAEAAVKAAQEGLEEEVQARTAELANEISERKRAEEKIRSSLEEKEVLLKEIHHRVKNNMQVISSLLSLQCSEVEDAQTLELFQESQNRIRSMALIHEQLYRSHSRAKIDFRDYLSSLTSALLTAYRPGKSKVNILVETNHVQLALETAIPLGLLTNELVSNSLKYGFPDNRTGTIEIILRQNRNALDYTIRDNGVGMPASVENETVNTLGLRLVRMLAKQLRAQHAFQRSSEGTAFHLQIELVPESSHLVDR